MFLFILSVTLFQLLSYFLLDKWKIKRIKGILFGSIILSNLLIFPRFFFEETVRGCGMLNFIVVVMFFFWGGIVAICTHVIYQMLCNASKSKEKC